MKENKQKESQIGRAKIRHLNLKPQTHKKAEKKPSLRQLRQKFLKVLQRLLIVNLLTKQHRKIKQALQKKLVAKDILTQKKYVEKIKIARRKIARFRRLLSINKLVRAAFLRKYKLRKLAKQNVHILYLKRRKVEKNQRLSLFKRKRFVDLISRAALNEITPRQKFSFKMFGKMLSKRNLLANTLEKSFLTERFNKSYNFFLSDMESLITLNSIIGKWWFKPHVAFYKKRRFIVPTMLTRVIKNYYLRPLHLRSQRGLRAWLLFTPVLRLSRKIMSHDLSKLYPKKINIIFKWVYNSNMTAQVLLAYLVSRLEKLYLTERDYTISFTEV